MAGSKRECLPLPEVLDTVVRASQHVLEFYDQAAQNARDNEARDTFSRLREGRKQAEPKLEEVCKSLQCGETELEGANQDDIDFLSAIAQSGFYRHVGKPAELANPELGTGHLVDNGLKLEKDLMLFYLKFHGISCAAHRSVFSDLIQLSQRHVSELNNLRIRLSRTESPRRGL